MTAAGLDLAPQPAPGAGAERRWAAWLGYAGLLPFLAGALLVWLVSAEAHPYVTLMLSAYAAVIVSFLGAIHWGIGFVMSATGQAGAAVHFRWGVVPALVAWPALVMPPSAGLVVQGVMLVGCYLADRMLYPRHGLAAWLTLRFRLSSVAALACFVGAAGT